MVVIVPSLVNLEKSYPYHSVHKLVNDIGIAEGFHVIDLLPWFQGKKSSQFWVHPIDHHPNEKAHKVIADLLFDQAEFKKVLFELYGTKRKDPIQRAH
jgi:exonuclease I